MFSATGSGSPSVPAFASISGRSLCPTPVFETYWRFAAARQEIFFRRIAGQLPPWTDDPVLACYRFTNVYRATDRVSQYLICNVIYSGPQTAEDIVFRTILFKLFNRIETWEALEDACGPIAWARFDANRYAAALDALLMAGRRIYSAAYIMPSPPFGAARKHRNHLALLSMMMADGLPLRIERAKSLCSVFQLLRSYCSIGDFLAYQFAVDLNYSELTSFSEMDFVVPGPGAKEGISKCFVNASEFESADIIRAVADYAEAQFKRLGLQFKTLWGRRLQLVDCQNLFCEVAKYARVVHPDVKAGGRTRIKQRYEPTLRPTPQWYPPKWNLRLDPDREVTGNLTAGGALLLGDTNGISYNSAHSKSVGGRKTCHP